MSNYDIALEPLIEDFEKEEEKSGKKKKLKMSQKKCLPRCSAMAMRRLLI